MLKQVAIFVLALVVHQVPAKEIESYVYVHNVDNKYVPSSGSSSRIVSGWNAQPGQHPHQVYLRMVRASGTISGCGGSIVHKEWIITAAHCSAKQLTIDVRAGSVLFSQPDVTIQASEVHIYPTFVQELYNVTQVNDISLLKLSRPLQYNQNIRSIRIQPSWDASRDYANELVYASGFGRIWTEGTQPSTLQWVYLRGVSNTNCARVYGTRFVTDNTICARYFNVTSQSICQGDSGGPLVHVSPEGEPILIGVSSFVPAKPHGCHSGYPAAFIRPGAFHSWFKDVSGIDFENLNESEENSTTEEPSTPSPTTVPPTTELELESTTVQPTTIPEPSTTSAPDEEDGSGEEEDSSEEDSSEEDSSEEDSSEEESDEKEDNDDKEISELLKKLEVKVKVKVKLSKYGQKKKIKKEHRITV